MSKIKAVVILNRPFRRWIYFALIAVSVITILITLLIVQPWSTPFGPQRVVAEVYAATEKVQSCRFYTESTSLDVATGLTINSQSEGACIFPDSFQMKVTHETTSENIWRTMEIIVVGKKMYLRYDDNDWSTGTLAGTSFQFPEPTANLELLRKMQVLPEAVVDGVTCFHFKETVNLEELLKEAHEDIVMTIEVWVGKGDSLLRRIKLHQQFLKEPEQIFEGGTRVILSEITNFYDYNQPIQILPPQPRS